MVLFSACAMTSLSGFKCASSFATLLVLYPYTTSLCLLPLPSPHVLPPYRHGLFCFLSGAFHSCYPGAITPSPFALFLSLPFSPPRLALPLPRPPLHFVLTPLAIPLFSQAPLCFALVLQQG